MMAIYLCNRMPEVVTDFLLDFQGQVEFGGKIVFNLLMAGNRILSLKTLISLFVPN
jgi:hypothetical protein